MLLVPQDGCYSLLLYVLINPTGRPLFLLHSLTLGFLLLGALRTFGYHDEPSG